MCYPLDLWKEIQDAVDTIVDHTTLADLVEKQKQKLQKMAAAQG